MPFKHRKKFQNQHYKNKHHGRKDRPDYRNKKNESHRHSGKSDYKNAPKIRKYNKQQEQLTEPDVGITEFISTLDGFQAVIKARYSDFHVHEINLDYKIAKLTNTTIPPEFHKEKLKDDAADKCPEIIPSETWDSIKALLESEGNKEVEFDVTALTKDERTVVHKSVKEAFGQKVVAKTITKDEKKYVVFKKYNKADKTDHRSQWPVGLGEYVYFLVYKEALDTMEVCMKISDCLKMPTAVFTYAGVKDRRAKTTQWFCVKKVEPWKLLKRTNRLRNIRIGNFDFKDKSLKLGDLLGNYFKIALRNVQADYELIKAAVESLEQYGFINYYGLQRFGNDKEVPTYEIGKQLLLGNWKEACSLILKVKTSDSPDADIAQAKKVYNETGDAKLAVNKLNFSRNKFVEAKLLDGLAKIHGNDYVTALESIPRNMRLLYMHSFQSFIWNKMASVRIQKFGTEPVVGDLVLTQNSDQECDEIIDAGEVPDETSEVDYKGVKVLKETDLADHTMYDIVLPLPGHNIVYPENMKDAYKSILEEHGLSLEMPKQKVKTYSLGGAYRKLFGEVKDLSWKIMYYNEPNYDLIRSDVEEMKGLEEPQSIEGGQYKALILNFSLKPSNYATMALREILKEDTSCSRQSELNNYHESAVKRPADALSKDEPAEKQRKLDESETQDKVTEEDSSEKIGETPEKSVDEAEAVIPKATTSTDGNAAAEETPTSSSEKKPEEGSVTE